MIYGFNEAVYRACRPGRTHGLAVTVSLISLLVDCCKACAKDAAGSETVWWAVTCIILFTHDRKLNRKLLGYRNPPHQALQRNLI